jgi:hydrogenase maturation protein HypF
VVYNRAIRETIAGEVRAAGLEGIREYPLGDGRVSFGQVVCGGERGGAMEAALPYFTG